MFGAMTQAVFQQDYWRQQAGYLGKVAVQGLLDLGFNDLVTLAAQPEVESRLVYPMASPGEAVRFDVAFGPFVEPDLSAGAMLMIQNLESFSFEISQWLCDHFGFLPRWRIEDVMATLAMNGGSCGAHFDQYDVFLVQLSGTKTWQVDAGGHTATDLAEDSQVRLLKTFQPESEFIQGPGDVLYVPPGVGHHGIASDDCITLSVGIRNPLLTEMASHLADQLLQQEVVDACLSDHFGGSQIAPDEVSELGDKLVAALRDEGLLATWYGRYMTELRDPELLEPGPEAFAAAELAQWRAAATDVSLDLPCRIAVQAGRLFINGEAYAAPANVAWLETLQQQRTVAMQDIPEADNEILLLLVQTGAVIL
ncbi:MAG: JmjC domain-containing protein [Pseudomonadales bacterium]